MSVEASDVQTDCDCEELVEDGSSFSLDTSQKRTQRRGPSGKPPTSARSPYLSSLKVAPRRAAVSAWRPSHPSGGDCRRECSGESDSTHLSSISNGHDLSHTQRSVCEVTPDLLRQTIGVRKPKHLHSAANGSTLTPCNYRDKEDMYDEIIRLKKSLQTQKSDNQLMKVKLRRLEEENAKREKQIEELLDPTKAPEFTRGLVERKDGSVILNGLKQRILKLEQQCREKENALSKLQGELRSTNLEELKVRVQTYFQEIQSLRTLLESAERSSRAESKCSQRQQKVLSSTVHRLRENLREVQQENAALREELDTDSPVGGLKGYRGWSRQRLLRRLLEVEKRREDSERHTQSERGSSQLDVGIPVTPTDCLGVTIATEAEVSVGGACEGVVRLRLCLGQLEKERAELQQTVNRKEEEVRQLRTERHRQEEEMVRRRGEETKIREKERQQHRLELERLLQRIQTLETVRVPFDQSLSSWPFSAATEERDSPIKTVLNHGGSECVSKEEQQQKRADLGRSRKKENAARTIQRKWRKHRERVRGRTPLFGAVVDYVTDSEEDVVTLQSVMRAHLLRASQLREKRAAAAAGGAAGAGAGDGDVAAVVTIQSALRGHLSRCELLQDSPISYVPSTAENHLSRKPQRGVPSSTEAASVCEGERTEQWPVSRGTPTADQAEVRHKADSGGSSAGDSDDSDDVIVSPSRPVRSRELLLS